MNIPHFEYRGPTDVVLTSGDIERMGSWLMETFGGPEHLYGAVAHLHKEADELLLTPNDPHEVADPIIIAIHCGYAAGLSGAEIIRGLLEKHEINMNRTWGPRQADGVIEHIRE